MALLLKDSIFYHIPKTGGVWVNETLREMGLVKEEYRQPGVRWPLNLVEEHVSPARAKENVVGGLPSFAFIRNPITWYQSFWRYKQSGWDEPYVRYGSDDFNEFMTKIMSITPGFLTRVYKEFDDVTYMGKLENIRGDLVSILSSLEKDFSKEIITNKPAANVTSERLGDRYEPKVLKKMKKLEKWIFKKYYPESL